MNKLLFNSIFIMFTLLPNYLINAQSDSGWDYLNFIPDELYSISFVDSLTGWAVNNYELIYTFDGGENWTYQDVEYIFRKDMKSVFFINQEFGWILGNKLWKTIDGGKSWIIKSLGLIESNEINTMFFLNQNIGWLAGDSARVLKTLDAGETWEIQTSGLQENLINSIYFLDSLNGWACGNSYILKTTDSGINWDVIYISDDEYITSIYFLDSLNGWAASSNGNVISTNDGGASWHNTTIDLSMLYGSHFTGIHFTDKNHGVLIGTYYDNFFESHSLIYRTNDGGINWHPSIYDYSLAGMNSLTYAGGSTYYIAGNNSILRSNDIGNSWVNQRSQLNCTINKIRFVDKNDGWAVGEDVDSGKALVLKSSNGGNSWVKYLFDQQRFNDASILDDLTIWAVGSSSVIHTMNGGESWKTQSIPEVTSNLHSIDFIDQDTGWLVGWNLPVFNTTDGGLKWEANTSGKYYLRKVYFLNSKFGWAVGILDEKDSLNKYHTYGHILRTTNGGQVWEEVKTDEGQHLYSVFFIDQNTGWITGTDHLNHSNIVLKSTDGGRNWIVQAEFASGSKDIYFIDQNNGWLTTEFGDIFYSDNGGDNWVNQFTPYQYSSTLNTIHFSDNSTGWAAGQNGVIVKTTNGGVTSLSNSNNDSFTRSFDLSQNYPNPFNPLTTITFSISYKSAVKLTIYDIMGQKVKSLINKQMVPGVYSVKFDATLFSSGIYFYRINVGDYSETKKMILVK